MSVKKRCPRGATALALLVLAACGSPSSSVPIPPASAPPVDAIDAGIPPPAFAESALRQGEGLEAPLRRLELTADERLAVQEALSDVADVRRLPVGAGVATLRSAEGDLLGVALRDQEHEVVRLVREGESFVARRETLARRVERSLLAATIRSSVYEAVVGQGSTPELVLAFSDIFQWDLDFFADPREGDELAILFETLRRGEVPEGTPRWREHPDEPGEVLGPGRILAAAYRGGRVSIDGFRFDDGEGGEGYYDREGRSLRKTFLKSPLNYRRISSGFSRARRNPVTRKVLPHRAVDYAAAPGTPVVASADGRVVASGWNGALGRHVRLRHGAGRYETVYGHFSRIARGITPGARVEQNQLIGYVGSTGRATGPHLHYEVHRDGHPVNPLTLDNPSTRPVSAAALAAFERERDGYLASLGPLGVEAGAAVAASREERAAGVISIR